jgi:zinc/manganese transport system ATP-binding protein
MTDPILRLTNVAAGFRGRALWSGLDLDVDAGEFVTVLGGNGTGKTTLLRILLGRLAPRTGGVEVLGGPPRRGNPAIGYVPQQRAFDPDLPLRGQDLVRYGLDGHRWGPARRSRESRHRIQHSLAAVGAEGYANRPIGRLSGGEQQRLRLAQALVAAPKLLLADEPLLSLDLASQQQISAVIEDCRRTTGAAVLLVTHDINPVLPYTDRILYLTASGWCVGTPDEVLTGETLSALYGTPIDVVRVRDRVLIVGTPDEAHHPGEPVGLLDRR